VAAERARLRGEVAQAGEFFARAIAAAHDSRFPHIEAIASELAMNLWRQIDAARAETLRTGAITAYEAWGAPRKANALRAMNISRANES